MIHELAHRLPSPVKQLLKRLLRRQAQQTVRPIAPPDLHRAKTNKLERIRPLLREDMPFIRRDSCFDFLTDDLRDKFNIVDTNAVSFNSYDNYALALIDKFRNGIMLDCGAGLRETYYDNVVNFEIVAYETTDVRGVGEVLPFKDGVFDAVFSLAVLEHVKDPFQCAKEIVRVLKPGGELMCCVPFLQPLHGYPHHYYNMTCQGLENLFSDDLEIDKIDCYYSNLPISSLNWIVRSWADGLSGGTKQEFLDLRIRDLLGSPIEYLNRQFVTQLSREKNLELACANVLFGHKPSPDLRATASTARGGRRAR